MRIAKDDFDDYLVRDACGSHFECKEENLVAEESLAWPKATNLATQFTDFMLHKRFSFYSLPLLSSLLPTFISNSKLRQVKMLENRSSDINNTRRLQQETSSFNHSRLLQLSFYLCAVVSKVFCESERSCD